jgi:hypothetical protein
MPAFNPVNSLVEALAEKVHNLGADTLKVVLCNAANAPTAAATKLSDLTTIDHTNLSDRTVAIASSGQTGGTYKLTLTDLVLTASGAVPTFRYVVLYNESATNDEVIGYYDRGSDITLEASGDQVIIDFDGTNGALTIA